MWLRSARICKYDVMTTPLIVLAHGSPDPRGVQGVHALALRVSATAGLEVHAAFLDHAEPTLVQVAEELARRGLGRAIVVPLFLSRAFHVRVDVPAAVTKASDASGLELALTPPLGLVDEWREAIDALVPAGDLVLATAGTSSATAQQDLRDFAAAWSESRGSRVVVAYASQAAPTVDEAIEQLQIDAIGEVSVASLVLFDGVLPDRIRESAGERLCTAPLDRTPALAEVVLQRYRGCWLVEPTDGGVRCENCSDSCNRK